VISRLGLGINIVQESVEPAGGLIVFGVDGSCHVQALVSFLQEQTQVGPIRQPGSDFIGIQRPGSQIVEMRLDL